jgi:hypothetical protein
MKKQNKIEQLVRLELSRGHSKQEILTRLSQENDRDEVLFLLNILPEEQLRRQHLWLNRLLCLLLLAITVKKLYDMAMLQLAAISTNQFSPLLLLDLIVPMINFYVLSKILRFHRQGYQFMAVLGVLALLRPENRMQPDLSLYIIIVGLSVLLLLRLFPKNRKIVD